MVIGPNDSTFNGFCNVAEAKHFVGIGDLTTARLQTVGEVAAAIQTTRQPVNHWPNQSAIPAHVSWTGVVLLDLEEVPEVLQLRASGKRVLRHRPSQTSGISEIRPGSVTHIASSPWATEAGVSVAWHSGRLC